MKQQLSMTEAYAGAHGNAGAGRGKGEEQVSKAGITGVQRFLSVHHIDC